METAYSITAISALATCIVALAMYIKHLHSKHTREQIDNLLKMTEAMMGNKMVVENNTKITQEVKTLLHSVNERIIEIKVNGKKK